MRNLTLGAGGLLVAVAAVLLARSLGAEPGESESFPEGDGAGWERLALYIGINEYADENIRDLGGCVSDMKRLRAILRDRYGFKRDALLTNEKATREAVARALRDLLEQTRKATANGVKEPLVVLAYAGHGNLLADQDGDEKTKRKGPKRDSSWVMHDSSKGGNNDIRDDDLRKVLQAIQQAGATIVLFVDACHSGTAFRGSEDAMVRSVRSGGTAAATGPRESLFPDLPDAESPRLASFAACQDSQEAWEEKKNGIRGGCFTHTLVTILQRSESIRSYEEFGRLLCERFASDWPGGKQHPLVRVSDGMESRLFFGKDVAPPYARIARRIDKNHVELRAGSIHGLAPGTRIEFFVNLDDLAKRRGVLARGTVASCDPGTAKVKLNRPTKLKKTVVARIVPSSLPVLRLHIAGELSAGAKEVIDPMRTRKQALFAAADEPYEFAVVDGGNGSLGIFAPGAWSSDTTAARPVARVPYDAKHLLHFAQLQRLMAFHADESRLEIELLDGDDTPLPRDPATQLVTVAPGTTVRARISNRGSEPLHLFAWVYEEELADGRRFDAAVLWPNADDADGDHEVKAGESYRSRGYRVGSTWSTRSRLHVRVIATDRYYDFALMNRLVSNPELDRSKLAASRAAGGAEDGLLDLFESVASGEGATRGMQPTERIWATAGAAFDVGK
ncbi:MAG: caspase family protein [Planctomycetota bacterium]